MARIAIILGRLVIGGSVIDTLEAAAELQYKHEVFLISGNSQPSEMDASHLAAKLTLVKHFYIPGFSSSFSLLSDLKTYLTLKDLLKQIKPDVVHTHSAKAGLVGRLAAKQAKVPKIIHTYHGLLFKDYFNGLINRGIVLTEKWLARQTHTIIALSSTQKKELTEIYKICPLEKVKVIPLGLNTQRFNERQSELRHKFRAKYYIGEGEIAIAMIGRMVPIKNYNFFLQVIAALSSTGHRARFFIIGDGPLRQTLQQEATSLGIDTVYFPEEPVAASLTMTSWITDMPLVLAGIDITMLTSLSEGTPVSLLESQAAAKPVVAPDVGGIADTILDGKTGFIVAKNNLVDFVQKLTTLINNEELRIEMGAAGRAFVTQNFSRQRQVDALETLYQAIVSEAM